jgi:LPS-assembly protein
MITSRLLLGLLLAFTSLTTHAETIATKALLQADHFTFDQANEVFNANGKVELEQDGQLVYADHLEYDRKNDKVTAIGNVIIVDQTGQTFFAKQIELHSRLKTGAVEQLGLVFTDGSRAAASYGEKKADNTTALYDAVYSPCNLCEADPQKPPLWQLRASKVVHDQNTKDIYYHRAKMEVKGIPIAYTPYFAHPDPSVKARSGILVPKFSSDSKKGFMLRNYYYQNISPQQDATLEFSNTQKTGSLIGAEWRNKFDYGDIFFLGSINKSTVRGGSNDDQIIREEDWRGHVKMDSRFNFTDNWRGGLRINRASDDYYLRDFDYGSESILTNVAYVEHYDGRNYGNVSAYYFQDIRPDISTEQPDILPLANYNLVGAPNATLGGRWALNNQAVTLFRSGEQSISRISTVPSWERRDILPGGLESTVDTKLRADSYWVRKDSPYNTSNGQNLDNTEFRAIPTAQGKLSYPLVRPAGMIDAIIEPKLALSLAPNFDDRDIPNEDSRDVEVNISNLFDTSRFSGVDRVENGSHLAYGVKMGGYHQNGNSAFITLGQSYRITDDNPFPNGSGLENERSDIVGQLETTFQDRFYTDYRFQLNEEDLESRKHELQAALLDKDYELRTNYIFAEEVDGTGIGKNRQQLGLSSAKALNPQWAIGAEALRDLSGDSGLLRSGLALQYKNECIRATLRGERDLTERLTGGSDSRVIFSLGLRNLGGYDTPILEDDELYRPFGTESKL